MKKILNRIWEVFCDMWNAPLVRREWGTGKRREWEVFKTWLMVVLTILAFFVFCYGLMSILESI